MPKHIKSYRQDSNLCNDVFNTEFVIYRKYFVSNSHVLRMRLGDRIMYGNLL